MAIKPKFSDVMNRVGDALKHDAIRFSDHALQRMDERLYQFGMDESDVLRVLRKGRREEDKDKWDELYQEWTYGMRGRTIDGDELRVSVAFKNSDVLIVTVINLDLE
jgi:hypothetical protein